MESILDRMAGELGASGIVVPLSSGPLTQLRSHPGARPRLFRSLGGCYYPFELNRYTGTRVKPQPADWAKGRHALEQLSDCCRQRGLELRVALAATDCGRLAAKYPEASTASLWGDRSTSQVCLLNGDVAELFRGMAIEVGEQFGPSALEWSGVFDEIRLASGADEAGAHLGPLGLRLLNVCCCESCRQAGIRAGIDTDRIVRWMDERLTGALQRGEPLEGGLEDWPEAQPFLDWMAARREAMKQVLESIRRASSCPMYVHLPADAESAREPSLGTSQKSIWSGSYVWIHTPPALLESTPARGQDSVQLSAYDPLHPDGAWLVQLLHTLAGRGVSSVNLVHYGRVPIPHLAGIKQAIRFARRRDVPAI